MTLKVGRRGLGVRNENSKSIARYILYILILAAHLDANYIF